MFMCRWVWHNSHARPHPRNFGHLGPPPEKIRHPIHCYKIRATCKLVVFAVVHEFFIIKSHSVFATFCVRIYGFCCFCVQGYSEYYLYPQFIHTGGGEMMLTIYEPIKRAKKFPNDSGNWFLKSKHNFFLV